MILLHRPSHTPPLTADQRDEIDALEPVDYRAYFWRGSRGWTCEIYPPVTTWGTSGPPVAEACDREPMRAFRIAFSRGAMPRAFAEWQGCRVEVTG